MLVNMIGLGYIGLPTAAVMASKGLFVHGVDINRDVCNVINAGGIHIVEPGLKELVYSVTQSGHLKADTKPEICSTFVIAVPTPFKGNLEPDLTYVKSAVYEISSILKKGDLIILESTSPVGTTAKLANWLKELRPDLSSPLDDEDPDVSIAYCPERVLPGKVLEELISNDRIIGGLTNKCSLKARDLYSTFVKGTCYLTNANTAEMAKLTENSFRDVNIAFANELSIICDELKIDPWELIELSNKHPRVNILQPGCGVGGHCIAVDPWFIVDSAPSKALLIRQAREVNDHKPDWVVEKVKEAMLNLLSTTPNLSLDKMSIAFYGLSFKPNIDDVRESPAIDIVKKVANSTFGKAIKIRVTEPNLGNDLPLSLKGTNVEMSSLENSKNSLIHVVLVAHDEFKKEPILSKKSASVINVAWDTRTN